MWCECLCESDITQPLTKPKELVLCGLRDIAENYDDTRHDENERAGQG
jgi:hypothetical protein